MTRLKAGVAALLLLSSMAVSAQSGSDRSSLVDLNREFSVCQTMYYNTGNKLSLGRCTSSLFTKYDLAIQSARSMANYPQKAKWDAINSLVNKQWESCDKAAKSTQNNSSIIMDKLSCEHVKFRTLLYEAEKLNL